MNKKFKKRSTKLNMTKQHYKLHGELTARELEFFDLVEKCDYIAVLNLLTNNRLNINITNYQGITPLNLAIQNNCMPLVNLFLHQTEIKLGDAVLFAIAHDNFEMVKRLIEYQAEAAAANLIEIDVGNSEESDEFLPTVTPLMLASQCGRYEMVRYLLDLGHTMQRPHPPWCRRLEQCDHSETVDVVAEGCARMNVYKAVSNPTYVCCTSPEDPVLECFRLYRELVKCGDYDRVYQVAYATMARQLTGRNANGGGGLRRRTETWKIVCDPAYLCCTSPEDPVLECFRLYREPVKCGDFDKVYQVAYAAMARQVKEFSTELLDLCRTSDEVKTLLREAEGSDLKGYFPYPRLMAAVDYKQKEFVAHTKVQQVLENEWIGSDWTEWRTYSTMRKFVYSILRLFKLVWTVPLGTVASDSDLNRRNKLPFNRMIDGLVTYVMFLALLFAQSNLDKNETPRGAPPIWLTVPIVVFVVGHVVEKTKLWWCLGTKRYLRNMRNVSDVVMLMLFTSAYAFWIVAEIAERLPGFRQSEPIDRKYWHWADPQLVAEALFAVAAVMAYMRLLFLCQLNYYVGPMQVSLGKAINDFGKFLTFFFIIMAAYTFGLGNLYRCYSGMKFIDPDTNQMTRQEESFTSLSNTFHTLFWGIFCMTPLEATNVVVENGSGGRQSYHHDFTELVGFVLFASFEVFMVIVLLNMLIAAVSATFEQVDQNSETEWLFGRTKVFINYMSLNDLPPPFNLLTLIKTFIPKSNNDYQLLKEESIAQENSIKCRKLIAELTRRYYGVEKQL